MGQQHRKNVKRRRRTAYLDRKKALARQGISRKVVSRSAKTAEAEDKPAAKKAVKKKAAKKTAKPAEGATPEVDETQGTEESAE